ncbi:hypothetical protein [Streptomyces sp. NPDC046727]|uniref:hypothetical protein n=1 Tax=Streptomyces sp. NPDC046727 TaxID=3155373 RepID=UPI0033C9DF14
MRSSGQPLSPQPWPGGPPHDPYALTAYGGLTVVARAASALAEEAVDALESRPGHSHLRPLSMTPRM